VEHPMTVKALKYKYLLLSKVMLNLPDEVTPSWQGWKGHVACLNTRVSKQNRFVNTDVSILEPTFFFGELIVALEGGRLKIPVLHLAIFAH
jgi:hypothetical protein